MPRLPEKTPGNRIAPGTLRGAPSSTPAFSEKAGSPLAQVKSYLYRHHLHARKGLGQHFLVDEGVLERIIAVAELSPQDIIMEVGAGLGILTRELAQRVGRVIAVELDDGLAEALKIILKPFPNVLLVHANALDVNPASLAEREGFTSYKIVANIPYYITSPLLRHFLEAPLKPSLMVVMVQREVGEAIVASPGKLSLLAISVQFYGHPRIMGYVSRRCFFPPPEVDSVILRIDLYPKPIVEVMDITGFFRIVDAGFSSPRKQLRNSLARGLGWEPNQAGSLLKEAGINPQRRAQTLSLEEWARIERAALARREV